MYCRTREMTFGVEAVLPYARIRIYCHRCLREEEKANPEEHPDGRSCDDPDGEEVEEDTDRKSTRYAAWVRCSSRQGRQQPLAPDTAEHV
jgi:hypothetical protein